MKKKTQNQNKKRNPVVFLVTVLVFTFFTITPIIATAQEFDNSRLAQVNTSYPNDYYDDFLEKERIQETLDEKEALET